MSMMSVRPVLMSGGEPSQAALRMSAQANALAGLNGCHGPHCRGLARAAGVGGLGLAWSDTLQNLATAGVGITGQILLNKNQAKSVESNPYGTTVYYPAGGTTAPVPAGSSASSDNMILIMGGAALLVMYLVMSKR